MALISYLLIFLVENKNEEENAFLALKRIRVARERIFKHKLEKMFYKFVKKGEVLKNFKEINKLFGSV